MANNRMYLVCRGCNTRMMLGKTMGSGYYTNHEDISKELNVFYDNHRFCDKIKQVNNENQFELCYESAIDNEVKEV